MQTTYNVNTNKFTFAMCSEEYMERSEGYEGLCLKCGEEAFNVEPDARRYACETCGEKAVYGMEELLVMGALFIEEEEE